MLVKFYSIFFKLSFFLEMLINFNFLNLFLKRNTKSFIQKKISEKVSYGFKLGLFSNNDQLSLKKIRGEVFATPVGGGQRRKLNIKAPGVIKRGRINTPVYTGLFVVDAFFPLGRGQRELIIGDKNSGKAAVIIDIILNQRSPSCRHLVKQLYCIYVSIGVRNKTVRKYYNYFDSTGAVNYTTIVHAGPSSTATLQHLAPYSGCTIGDWIRDNGSDALIIFDSLTKHAKIYRQIALIARKPGGREAYPGDIFYAHSRLLERSGKLWCGGSLTALPVIQTQLNDITGYISTNVISITDGQLYMIKKGGLHYPSVDLYLSVSRVGTLAQKKPMKKRNSKLKLKLYLWDDVKPLFQLSLSPRYFEKNKAIRNAVFEGQRLETILIQKQKLPYAIEVQNFLLIAYTFNLFRWSQGKTDVADLKKFLFSIITDSYFLDYLPTPRYYHPLTHLVLVQLFFIYRYSLFIGLWVIFLIKFFLKRNPFLKGWDRFKRFKIKNSELKFVLSSKVRENISNVAAL